MFRAIIVTKFVLDAVSWTQHWILHFDCAAGHGLSGYHADAVGQVHMFLWATSAFLVADIVELFSCQLLVTSLRQSMVAAAAAEDAAMGKGGKGKGKAKSK
jgi:hypothetical protein